MSLHDVSRQPAARASKPNKPVAASGPEGSRRWSRRIAVATGIISVLLLIAPWIVAKTSLRNLVLNRILGGGGVEASSDSASFSWFSSVELNGLNLSHVNGSMRTRVTEVAVEKTLLGLLTSGGDLGRVVIRNPAVEIYTDGFQHQESQRSGKTLLTADVQGAQIMIAARVGDKPLVDLQDLNVVASIQRGENGRVLQVEPVTIFDHEPLTPSLCSHGLQLIAPLLADNTSVSGELSLELSRLRMLLDRSDQERALEQLEVRGTVALHNLVAHVQSPMWNRVFALISGVLGKEVPTQVTVANDTSVAFEVHNNRILHHGMAFIIPEVSPKFTIETSGSVGFDETLDLAVKLNIPFNDLHSGPLARQLSQQELEIRITGTLSEPQVSLPEDRSWLKTLAGAVLKNSAAQEAADTGDESPLASGIMDLVEGFLAEEETGESSLPAQLAERWRERRRLAAERRAASGASGENSNPVPRRRLFPRLRDQPGATGE